MYKAGLITMVFLMLTCYMSAQQKPMTIEETINLAIENNSGLKASVLQIEEANALVGSAFSFDKTSIYYSYDNNNRAGNDVPLKVFGVSQDFKFPTVYFADKKVNKAKVKLKESARDVRFQDLKKEVSVAYYNLSYAQNKVKSYHYLDSLYQNFAQAAARRFELGETNYLEMITSQSKQIQLRTLYKQSQQEVVMFKAQLKKIVQVDAIILQEEPLQKLTLQSLAITEDPGLLYFEQVKSYYDAQLHQEKQNLLPDLNLEYFQGTNDGLHRNLIGYQFGLKIPLLFSGNSSKIKAAKIAQDIAEEQQRDYELKWHSEQESLLARLQQYNEAIVYYETQGKQFSEEIIKTAERTLKEGEIDFFKYIQSVEISKEIELTYLENLNAYNQTIIAINYLNLEQ